MNAKERILVLDTETTGLNPLPPERHRIIEIGIIELIGRKLTGKKFHRLVNPHPKRDIDPGAQKIHGITIESLQDKPKFKEIADTMLEFIGDSKLVIHNARFDLGFLNEEFKYINPSHKKLEKTNEIIDTLFMARKKFPGERVNLGALCKRYGIKDERKTVNSLHEGHNALADIKLLASVYLKMTGGQEEISDFESENKDSMVATSQVKKVTNKNYSLKILPATEAEQVEHIKHLAFLDSKTSSANNVCIWSALNKDNN